ncbi:MAG: hypothetical protein QF655_03400 [Candidatus Woesearchaeota archaeon]|jgi:hypothetical protein|nr:hypothetical protein [Candidatus Woesearchaeota archaeon]|tara:strand:- start:156 stop:572 length:417 start_codon:yes stop_codon:yes gene_type:complete
MDMETIIRGSGLIRQALSELDGFSMDQIRKLLSLDFVDVSLKYQGVLKADGQLLVSGIGAYIQRLNSVRYEPLWVRDFPKLVPISDFEDVFTTDPDQDGNLNFTINGTGYALNKFEGSIVQTHTEGAYILDNSFIVFY